ncbi:MAG TPA: hypothetical protein VFG25_07255, partial [Nitrosopumilaceae archaeon]|nr:hypothetical protein [Nitrosopumilaceae archaeon]
MCVNKKFVVKDTFISSFSFTGYDLRNLVVIFLLFFISGLLIPQYIYAQSDVEIPEWIRGMVKFYADGDVSDKEFTAAIEHLIKIGVIKSPQLSIVNDEEEHMRQVTGVQNDVVVPIWIKNNARWYADGAISASDFARGIEFMVEEKIISSPNISVEPKPEKSSDIQTGSNNLDSTAAKLAFEVQKWNELSMWWLVNIKSAEVDILDEAAEQAWKKYSEEKNTDLMKVATDLENAARKANNDANRAVEIHKTAMKLAGDAKQVAISEGNHVLDLENDVKEQQKDFEFDQKISSVEDVENRISVTKTLQKE